MRYAFTLAIVCLPVLLAAVRSAGAPATSALPASISLSEQYKRWGLAAEQQQGPNCWAYSIVGCLDLEMSRARKTTVTLSAPYLAWAAAHADKDAADNRGSNFGRAGRALERYGICRLDLAPTLNVNAPGDTAIGAAAIEDGVKQGRGIRVDWIRFWRSPPGLTDAEMLAIRRQIAAGHPVAVGMYWPKALTVADKELCLLGTCERIEDTEDGHCVTLVGYETGDQFPGGGAFVIRNSWGPTWMQGGFGRMSFEYLRKYTNDAVAFSVDQSAPDGLRPNQAIVSNAPAQGVTSLTPARCRAEGGMELSADGTARFGKGRWLNDRHLFCRPAAPGDGLAFDVTAPADGKYVVTIAATRAPDYGAYTFSVDGKPLGRECDFSWPNVEPTGEMPLGTLALTKGKHTVRVQCAGKSVAAEGYLLGLDWVRLTPADAAQ